MVEELVKRCFRNKLREKGIYYRYNITPDKDDDGWQEAIFEAREYGIPIASFGDTSDKLVLHPGHLGYNFRYYWGNGSWTSKSCWVDGTTDDDKENALKDLTDIAIFLQEKFSVLLCRVNGTGKGYLSTYFVDVDPELYDDGDIVLFVYGLTNDYMENFIN